jgi:two-component system alkaline phosphatase synthesis response regulator PhoP
MNPNETRVLYAEDDPAIAKMYATALENHHIHVDLAADGEEALRKMSSNTYDFILLDIKMPTTSGIDVVRRLPPTVQGTRLIILSNLSPEDVPGDLHARAENHMVKADTTPDALARFIVDATSPIF